MKKNNRDLCRELCERVAVFLMLGFLVVGNAAAQSWSGLGADNNWSTGANWVGGVAPASSPATRLNFDSGRPRQSPVVDAPWTVNRLDFNFSSYTLDGQAITLDGVGAAIGLGNGSTLAVSNPIVLAAPAQFLFCFGRLTVVGAISGPGSLALSGGGSVMTLRGANTYAGGTTVSQATLDLRGSILGPVSVGSLGGSSPCNRSVPGTLTGSGTVSGPVSLAGLSSDLLPDLVLSTGDLFLSGSSRLSITINGPSQGSQYATANVTGTVLVFSAALRLLGSYTPVPGDVFMIIANDGVDAVNGTFAGLPEGATVTFNGVPLRISYVGGTGNDVTLTASAAAIAAADVRQVPTLSQWALMLLAALVLGIGMLRSRRVRR